MKMLLVVSFAAFLLVSPLAAECAERFVTPPRQQLVPPAQPAAPSDVPRFTAETNLVNVSFPQTRYAMGNSGASRFAPSARLVRSAPAPATARAESRLYSACLPLGRFR
jgi:hypothetical protein